MTQDRTEASSTGQDKIKNADVPSDTAGLPGAAEEASGAHFLRDTTEPAGEDKGNAKARRLNSPGDSR